MCNPHAVISPPGRAFTAKVSTPQACNNPCPHGCSHLHYCQLLVLLREAGCTRLLWLWASSCQAMTLAAQQKSILLCTAFAICQASEWWSAQPIRQNCVWCRRRSYSNYSRHVWSRMCQLVVQSAMPNVHALHSSDQAIAGKRVTTRPRGHAGTTLGRTPTNSPPSIVCALQ